MDKINQAMLIGCVSAGVSMIFMIYAYANFATTCTVNCESSKDLFWTLSGIVPVGVFGIIFYFILIIDNKKTDSLVDDEK